MDEIKLIEVKEGILSENDRIAGELRKKLTEKKTFLMNLMSSPGAGKTTLILKTIDKLKDKLKIGVIEADIESMVDAEKIAAQGIKSVQLKTGGLCHLDATMVGEGLEAIGMENFDLIIIENVGNLVCPAEFDTGANLNAMILSVPEGDDKPLKYPLMFTVCDVLLLNKIDYLPHSDFDVLLFKERVLRLKSTVKIFEVSGKTGEGIENWTRWLDNRVKVSSYTWRNNILRLNE
jgi:hydrogenase nickel incorporation protein HypB